MCIRDRFDMPYKWQNLHGTCNLSVEVYADHERGEAGKGAGWYRKPVSYTHLRPLRDRILFVAWHNGSFVLLHVFMKKTQKTPPREIEQAKRELADLKERGVEDEQ